MDLTRNTQHDEGYAGHSLHNLIYCSLASPDMDPAEIHKIIATAKHHNPRYGITGLLVFGSGIFFQWLEGPKDNVTSLMKIIGDDPRHLNVVVLSEEDEIRDRLFPDWDMELVEAAEIGDVLENALKEASDDKQKQMLAMFLQQLKLA
ncbi:BLUF domain containing protein [Burkholderiaceae bacterium]